MSEETEVPIVPMGTTDAGRSVLNNYTIRFPDLITVTPPNRSGTVTRVNLTYADLTQLDALELDLILTVLGHVQGKLLAAREEKNRIIRPLKSI